MAISTTRDLLTEDLASLIESARRRSKRVDRPVLASLTVHLGPAPDYNPAGIVSQPDTLLWEQPSRGIVLAGVGHATSITAGGPSRFRLVRERLEQMMDDAVIRQDSGAALRPAPLCFSGFSFDPEQPEDVAWFGYPDALAIVPRLLFSRSGSHLFLTASILVREDADPSLDAEDLVRLADRQIAAMEVVSSRPAPSQLLDPGEDARDLWGESVTALTTRIAAGSADKVVLARRIQIEAGEGFDASAVLQRLRERYAECTIFALRSGDACFLGATPEMLVSLQGRSVRADCLAGSARRGTTDDEDASIGAALLADDKERREHAFVARGLREALAPFCIEVKHPEEPGLRRYANVQHLHTPIEAVADGERHVLELVEALHPTPATSGLPRESALCLIREQELFARGWYAGPIGWIDSEGGGEFAVALRSALLRDDVASLYAGCGIVTGSEPEREWAESEIKLEAMLWALNARR
jgi:menaquinone-specific isochorismate synthase